MFSSTRTSILHAMLYKLSKLQIKLVVSDVYIPKKRVIYYLFKSITCVCL